VSKSSILREALRTLLAEHVRDEAIPTSARFLFYELVQRGTISKAGRRPDHDMIRELTALRDRGEIPWGWIVDETRFLEDFTGAPSLKEWMLGILPAARLDPWRGDEPLVLTESRSLAGVLRPIAHRYGVKIAPTNGQCRGFLHTKILPIIQPFHRVLYLGDHDLSGNSIEQNTKRVLEQEIGELAWERLALTQAQIDEYNLPVIIKFDRRFKDGGAHQAVETEALSQRIIIEILRNWLEQLLPEPLARVEQRAIRQRNLIQQALEAL
jgi:hypothetical protein